MLRTNAKTAERASLTGAFGDSRVLCDTYNKIYDAFRKMDLIEEELFSRADENTSIDDVGVMSRNLLSYLEATIDIDYRKHRFDGNFDFRDFDFRDFEEMFGRFFRCRSDKGS